MKSHLISMVFVILIYITHEASSSKLVKGGKNVCTFHQSVIVYSTRKTKVSTLETYSVCCSKFLFCWKKCKRSRVREKTMTITVSELRREEVYHCCRGYAVDSSGSHCSKPICDPPCENGGKCIKPGVCECQSGFEGILCQNDINECNSIGEHECSQRCINIPGSYLCACNRGFVPGDPKSKTCKDIDECKQLSIYGKNAGPCRCIGDKCGNSCQNTIGGYRCTCGAGYRLTLWNNCVDRNECIETPYVCPDRCINTPGSYKCECWEGFKWNSHTKKCEEINECSIGNGGCEQMCHNVYGGHVCSCKPGFYLADNRFSCIDINECKWATRCDPRRSECINVPGSYYCKCKTGFRFLESHGICLDRDECLEKTALCNQKCFNTFGSYRCGCHPGYHLDSDLKTCKDIDECSQKRCDQVCVNTPGSYKCFCDQGYELDIDDRSCIPKYCEKIQGPFFGKISCEGYTVGKRCRFFCNEGYHLDHDITRECLPHGKWSNVSPKCIPNSCKDPRPPPNGKLLLPCDVTFGSTCPVICVEGYVLRGPDLIKCEINRGVVKWDVKNIKCEEILVCKPNPCQHGGVCSIVTATTYSCNCTGTGYEGKNCDVGFITTEKLPKLEKNVVAIMKFKAKPEEKIELKIYPEDASIIISKDVVEMTNSVQSAQIEITGKEIGLKLLSFELTSQEIYAAPRPSLLLVYDEMSIDDSRVDSLSSLASDCFTMTATTEAKSCHALKLLSTAPWFKRSSSLPATNGIAMLDVDGAKFPLLLPGADQREIFYESDLSFSPVPKQKTCRKKPLTEGQLQYIGRYDLFSRDFIKAFNKLMPSWFQIELRENMKYFSEDMVRSLLVTGDKLKRKKYCSALAIDENSNFIVHVIYEQLVLKVGTEELAMTTNKAFCLAVDLCKKEAHIQVPEKFSPDVVNLLTLQDILSFKWKVHFRSVGFAETSLTDTRKCMQKAAGDRMMVFGGSRVKYSNEHGVNSLLTGIMVAGFKTTDSKTTIDSSKLCMDGESLMESPSWKSSTLPDHAYRMDDDDDSYVVKLTTSNVSPQKSIFSLEQQDGTRFKIKSGLRPLIKKSSRDIRFDVSYKVTEKSSELATDSNFNKYTNIETISYSVGDIDLELELMFPPRYLVAGINSLRTELKTWLDSLNDDINELIMDIDNTKLMNEKVKMHYAKGKHIVKRIEDLLNPAKASIDPDAFERIATALASIKSQLAAMGKGLKSVLTIKTFDSLSAHFNGSMCLFQPCIETVSVNLYPQSIETPWEGYCYDPSKASFQMWDTRGTVHVKQDRGSFFTFAPGDKFHMCLSVYGIKKGEFDARFNLLGGSHKLKFRYSNKKITVPGFIANIKGKYRFHVNATTETVLNRWDMMSTSVYGRAGTGSRIIKELQKSIDSVVSQNYHRLKQREQASRSKLQELVYEKSSIRGRMSHYEQKVKEANDAFARAEGIYANKQREYNATLKFFVSKRGAYVNMTRRLDTICDIKSCLFQCHKIDNCTVCQKEVTVQKSIPNCRRGYDNRTYSYKDSVDTTCSHFVEDRKLKHTGNCKRRPLEKHRAEQIVKELKNKQEKKIPFTFEDAWNLQLIDEKEGKKLEEAVKEQTFWRSFPGKLKSGSLIEKDFEKIKKYKNSTFAEKIRREQKQIKLKILWDEFSIKIKNGGRLNDDDIERIRKLNETFAAKLKISLDINEKLESGEQPSKEELKVFAKLDPKSYDAFIKARKQAEARRIVLDRISKKIHLGTLTAADLNELAKVDAKAAKAIEDGLKEQLNKKVSEMKSKLDNVSNAISDGDGNDRFGKLNKKLSSMTKNLKPYDKNQLKNLQDRIRNAVATKGSVFDKMLDRFDLALELHVITGMTSEFFRSLKAFSASLERFDLQKVFLQRENLIVKQLENLHRWFETLASFLDKLCSKCGKSCNAGGIIMKTIEEIRSSIAKFRSKVCSKSRIVNTKKLCSSLDKVLSFTQRYDVLKSRACNEIKQNILPFIQKSVEEIKDLGRADAVVFEAIWKQSKATVSIRNAYNSVVSGLKDTLLSSSVKVNFPAPEFNVLTAEVGKIARPGLYNIKEIEFFIAKEAVKSFNDALKLLPINTKQMSSKAVRIPDKKKISLVGKFQTLLDRLTESLRNLCSAVVDKSEIIAAIDRRVKRVLAVSKTLFLKMLNEKDLLSLFRSSKNVAATLEHAMRMSDNVAAMARKCSNTTDSPFAELESFLRDIKDFGAKTVQQLSSEIENKIRSIGDGIKSPIGKFVNLVERLATNIPEFDFPVIMSMGHDEAKLLLEAFKNYLRILGDTFNKLVEVIGKCKNCKIEEVFGDYNLKSIAEKLDKKLGPIASKLDKFVSNLGFAFQGAPLLFSSLEQIRTDLQSIYSSGASYSEKTFLDIVQGVKFATEAADLLEKGHFDFQVKITGDKANDVEGFAKELIKLKGYMFDLYQKTKDQRMEKSIGRIKKVLSDIPVATKKVQNIDKGTVDQLLDTIYSMGRMVKDVTTDIQELYRSPVSSYIENNWIPKVAKSLDEIETAKYNLVMKAEKLLTDLGVLKAGNGAQKDIQSLRKRKFSSMFKELKNAPKNRKVRKAARIAQKAQGDETVLKRITVYWRGVYKKVAGTIDGIKSRLLKLRQKFEKYMILYKDVKNAVEEIKKIPVSDIGKVKDNLEDLISSFKDYNFKTLLVSKPDIFKKKIQELKQLFQISGAAVKQVDDILQKCKSCSVDKILGYKYIKSLAETVDRTMSSYSEFIEEFGDKITDGVTEVQGISKVIGTVRERFKGIGGSKSMASASLTELGKALAVSADDVDSLQGSIERFTEIFIGKDVNLQLLGNGIKKVANLLSAAVNQSAEVAANIEDTYKEVKKIDKIFEQLSESRRSILKGPVQTRIEAAKEATKGIKAAINALPKVLKLSKKALASAGIDGDWVDEFESGLKGAATSLDRVRLKTDTVLKAAGIILEGKENITIKLDSVKESLKDLKDASWQGTIKAIKDVSRAFNSFVDSSLDAIASSSTALGKKLTKEGLTESILDAFGKQRLANLTRIGNQLSNVLGKLQKDSIPEIGKLTDAVDDYFDGLKDFDIKKALLSDPSVLKEKIGEFQDLADKGGDLLIGITDIAGGCGKCTMESILGNTFVKKVSQNVAETFDKLYAGVLDISSRFKKGKGGIQPFVNAAKEISKRFKNLVKSGKISSNTFKNAAGELKKTAQNLQALKGASKDVFLAVFNDDNDVSKLQESFSKIIDTVSDKLEKGSVLSEKVEKAYKTVEEVKETVKGISSDFAKFSKSPLELKTKLARKMMTGVQEIFRAVPEFLQHSANVSSSLGGNSAWLDSLSSELLSFNKKANSFYEKTDSLLKSAGLIAKDVSNIAATSSDIYEDVKQMRDLSPEEKFASFKNIVKKVDNVFNTSVDAAVKFESAVKDLTGAQLDISEGISKFGDSLSGIMQNVSTGVKFAEGIYTDITNTVNTIKSGPVAKVGALKDSIEDFVGSLNNYDLAEVLVQAPNFAKDKIGELKAIIKDSGKILNNVNSLVTKYCPSCDIDEVFGSEFAKKIGSGIAKGFDRITGNVTKFLDKVAESGENVLSISNSIKDITTQVKSLEGIKFDSKGLKKVANVLGTTSGLIQGIGDSSTQLAGVLFEKNKALNRLTGKFEGLVNFVGGFMNSTGKVVSGVSDAVDRVEKIRDSFQEVQSSFKAAGKGPLESRLKAVENIANGLTELSSGIPDLIESLGPDNKFGTFVRGFGTKVSDIANGMGDIVKKTQEIAGDVSQTIKAVDNIGKISGNIGNSFNKILSSPFAGKISAVKDMVSQIKSLTGEVNSATGTISSAVNKLTGKSIFKSPIFGKTTEKVLSDISGAVNLVADRYEKFQSLTKTVNTAFKSISSDPVNFALNDLPKLITQTNGLVSTLLDDTKGIAAKLGIQLEGLNLNPELVSASKEFFSFAKGTLGTIQSGKELFGNFKDLFTSKDFESGMKNFQSVIKNGKKFIENIDGLGQQLFKKDWSGMKGDFQKALNKIGDSVGINLQKTGEIFSKISESVTDVLSIATDFKSLLNMKEFNLETTMQAAKSVMNIAKSTTNILNRFGANIQTKVLEKIGSYVNIAMSVFNIAKGVLDFIKWVNDVCDITFVTDSYKKELTYKCLKGKISTMVINIPVVNCDYITKNITRGFGNASFCCNGKRCIYIQNQACLNKNAICVQKRIKFTRESPSVSRELAAAYLQYENAKQAMEVAQIDMKAAETLRERQSIAYNVSSTAYQLNTLQTVETQKHLASIRQNLVRLKRVINVHANTSKIRFIKAEFNTVFYSSDSHRIPLKVIIRDQTRLHKIVRFMIDFKRDKLSIKQAIEYLLRTMTDYTFTRKRRAVGDKNKAEVPANVNSCAALKTSISLVGGIVENLREAVNELPTTDGHSFIRKTANVRMSSSASSASRQLYQEIRQLDREGHPSLKNLLLKWNGNTQQVIREEYQQECFDIKDCLKTFVDAVNNLVESNSDISRKLMSDLKRTVFKFSDVFILPTKSSILAKLNEVKGSLNKIEQEAVFCHAPPTLVKQLPKSLVAYLGEEFTLSCKLNSLANAQYLWYLNKTALPAFNEEVLRISKATTEYEGSYHCKATTEAGTLETNHVYVTVKRRPVFAEELQSVSVPNTSPRDVRLICNTTAEDDASYSWWYQSLTGTIRKLRQRSAILDIGKARTGKSGVFWCEVSDGHMKLRSRKVVVALVSSKRRTHSARFEMQSVFTGSDCQLPSIKESLEAAIKSLILKEREIDGYITNVLLENEWTSITRPKKLSMLLKFEPKHNYQATDLDLVSSDAQIQYQIQKITSNFVEDKNTMNIKSSNCSLSLIRSNVQVEFEPPAMQCPSGMGLTKSRLRCETCLPGFFENGLRSCSKCPMGTFQPRFGALSCTPCGNGYLTQYPGSLDRTACVSSEFQCFDKLNLMLAVDTSIGEGYNQVKPFLKNLMRHFDSKSAKITVASFGNAARLLLPWDVNTLTADDVITNIKLGSDERRTDLLLDLAIGLFETQYSGYRNVLFIIAQGPTTQNAAKMGEKVARLKDLGTEIFYINAGSNALTKEAMLVSSSLKENHVFAAANDEELLKSSTYIAYSLCNSDEIDQ